MDKIAVYQRAAVVKALEGVREKIERQKGMRLEEMDYLSIKAETMAVILDAKIDEQGKGKE